MSNFIHTRLAPPCDPLDLTVRLSAITAIMRLGPRTTRIWFDTARGSYEIEADYDQLVEKLKSHDVCLMPKEIG